LGIVRVLSTDDEELLDAHGRLIEEIFPQFETISRCIGDQPDGIHDEETKLKAIPKIVELGREFEAMGVDAIVISCADDPGVESLRKILNIPVIGAGSAVAAVSLSYANRIGVLTMSADVPEPVQRILGDHLFAHARPEGVNTTLDLQRARDLRNISAAAKELKLKGSEAIALACTGYSSIGAAQYLRSRLNIMTVDPVIASGLVVRHLMLS